MKWLAGWSPRKCKGWGVGGLRAQIWDQGVRGWGLEVRGWGLGAWGCGVGALGCGAWDGWGMCTIG